MRMKAEELKKEHFDKVFSQILEVKRCMKCGRKLPEDSTSRRCSYCGGKLKTIYQPVANRVKENS